MILNSASVSEAMLQQLTNLFRLFSDKTRLNILFLLRDGEQHVTALCERLNLAQPTVSHHLGLLRGSNLLDNRRSGKQVFYGLSNRFQKQAHGGLSFRGEAFTVRLELKGQESD